MSLKGFSRQIIRIFDFFSLANDSRYLQSRPLKGVTQRSVTTSRATGLWQIVADMNFFGKKLKKQTMKKKSQNIKHKIYQKVMNRLINHR